jgi:quinol monooxygenase YgiN
MVTLRVVARIPARPDTVDAVKTVLLGLIAPTRAENGCIRYELLQNQADPTDFTFVEEWSGDAALQAHMTTPHIAAALGKLGELLGGAPDIRRYSSLA